VPYIKKEERAQFETAIQVAVELLDASGNKPGHLNFFISSLLEGYASNKGVCYEVLSETAAQASAAATEFERRVIAPYEDSKIQENGDVYQRLI
jgi:hypothetical protein